MSSSNFLTLMDQFFDESFLPTTKRVGSTILGSIGSLNIKEFKNRYEISVNAPGIDIKKTKIEIRDRLLTIKYEDTFESKNQEEESGELIRQEYSETIGFSRSVNLPKNVKEESIKAKYKNGILKIEIHKIPEPEAKNVEIVAED
jgi:HSP20 family protein